MKQIDKSRLGKKLRENAYFDIKKEKYSIEIEKAYEIIDKFIEADSLVA